MSDELDALWGDTTQDLHPKLRYWLAERERNAEQAFRVELVRPKQGLQYGPARLYVHVLDPKGEDVRTPDEMAWDPDLDEAFIQQGFPAVSRENEARRFALALRRSFRKPERRYGEGYFNAVLHDWLSSSAFAEHLTPLLQRIPEGNAHRGDAYTHCRDQIQAAVAGRARELTDRLGWDRSEAKWILGHAMAAYLDERFHISDRQALGLG